MFCGEMSILASWQVEIIHFFVWLFCFAILSFPNAIEDYFALNVKYIYKVLRKLKFLWEFEFTFFGIIQTAFLFVMFDHWMQFLSMQKIELIEYLVSYIPLLQDNIKKPWIWQAIMIWFFFIWNAEFSLIRTFL